MPDIDWDKWVQFGGVAAAVVTGAVVYLRGRKMQPEPDSPVATELKAIRGDFSLAVEALKTSLNDRLDEFAEKIEEKFRYYDERLREAETTVAILKDRQNRPRPGR